MTTREFRILGPVEAVIDGSPAELGYAKQRCVLALLLLDAGRLVPVDRIIDRVWGEDAPRSIRNVLYGHMARLRKSVGALRRCSGGYQLDVPPEEVDVHRFRALVARGRAESDDARRLGHWQEALRLWRGPALAGIEGDWADRLRLTLERERFTTRLEACDARIRLGLHDDAISELTELAGDDPLHERAVSRLMLALYRGGHLTAALDRFAELRRCLADQLGAHPAAEVEELHVRILRRDDSLSRSFARTRLASA